MTTDDDVIAQYRDEIVAEAALATPELDEIEDHLRTLAAELRAAGHADAIREACRRLGEPAALAREHARVRSPFGARLSRARAWSAFVLLVPSMLLALRSATQLGLASPEGLEVTLVIAVTIAMAARRTWARPLVMAKAVYQVVVYGVLIATGRPQFWWLGLLSIGALAFLAPWRRREVGATGWTLALLAPAFLGAYATVYVYIALPGSVVMMSPYGTLAFACATLAGCGVIMRARWAALACVAAAIGLVGSAPSLWAFTELLGGVPRAMVFARIVVGAATALVAAVVCWRTARSPLGTLRHVLD